MKNGQEFLKYLLAKDADGVLAVANNEQSGVEYILHVIAKVLDSSQDESCAMYIGEVITSLFKYVIEFESTA